MPVVELFDEDRRREVAQRQFEAATLRLGESNLVSKMSQVSGLQMGLVISARLDLVKEDSYLPPMVALHIDDSKHNPQSRMSTHGRVEVIASLHRDVLEMLVLRSSVPDPNLPLAEQAKQLILQEELPRDPQQAGRVVKEAIEGIHAIPEDKREAFNAIFP